LRLAFVSFKICRVTFWTQNSSFAINFWLQNSQ